MADWAGAYGAGGAAQALEQIVARQFLERKQAEIERAQRVQEAQAQAEMAQRAEQSRQGLALQYANLAADRDENYQNRTQHVTDTNVRMQRQTLEDQMKAGEKTGDVAREEARFKAEQDYRTKERLSRQDFERSLLNATRGGGGASPKDQIELERARLQLEAEKQKQANAQQERQAAAAGLTRERTDLASLTAAIRDHPYMASNVGPIDALLPTTRAGSRDFQAKKAQLLAALSLENRAKLKGSGAISDHESKTLERASTSLEAATDEATFTAELNRIMSGLGAQTRTQRNTRTGETRTQISMDGGKTWN